MTRLAIDGREVLDLHRYSLRWFTDAGGDIRGVLYRDGMRVAQPWRLSVDEENPGDEYGGNANTT